jgi:hypothetical protein
MMAEGPQDRKRLRAALYFILVVLFDMHRIRQKVKASVSADSKYKKSDVELDEKNAG